MYMCVIAECTNYLYGNVKLVQTGEQMSFLFYGSRESSFLGYNIELLGRYNDLP